MRMLLIPLVALSFLTGCDRASDPAPEAPEEEKVEETKPAAQTTPEPAPQPALTEAAIESLIFDALSPTGEAVASADGDTKFSLDNLPEAQRVTLNEAVQKAMSKIDLSALVSSLAGSLNLNGMAVTMMPGDFKMQTRTLSSEEAKDLGLDLESLRAGAPAGGGAGQVSISNVQVITVGAPDDTAAPPENTGDNGPATEALPRIVKTSRVDLPAESDPERSERIRSLLESGDSDALAGEIANLIQTGIDSATFQQAMGGTAPAPAPSKK